MNNKTVIVTVSRFDPTCDEQPHLQAFEVPVVDGMAVLQALDYIYEHLDPSLSYYDHGICAQGLCKRCTALVNGKPELICQYSVTTDVRVEPLPRFRVIKDLVFDKETRS
jgi:succinate dehydrogenase/fumarate reductase-like Fe-S protein